MLRRGCHCRGVNVLAEKKIISSSQLFLVFLKLGLISFGGPIAHLGYFRDEFVKKLKWVSDHAYGDLVALCQFLPGPGSSQVGIAIGLSKGGIRGSIVAWLGFTMPSALIMIAFGLILTKTRVNLNQPWIHGLKLVAVPVVAQALWGMGKNLCPDKKRASLAVFACIGASLIPSAFGQIVMILSGGVLGLIFLTPDKKLPESELTVPLSRQNGRIFLVIFFILLFGLPLISVYIPYYSFHLFESFYKVGALVFGGGHVVLPLLQTEVVSNGWVDQSLFLAGYGAAQAIPGPMFTFSAYLGAVSNLTPNGWLGGLIALVAIFLPSFLLIMGILPLWQKIRNYGFMQRTILGVNAAVVGLLLSAFYKPIWSTAILSMNDYLLAMMAFILLEFWKIPVWIIVLFCAIFTGLGWY